MGLVESQVGEVDVGKYNISEIILRDGVNTSDVWEGGPYSVTVYKRPQDDTVVSRVLRRVGWYTRGGVQGGALSLKSAGEVVLEVIKEENLETQDFCIEVKPANDLDMLMVRQRPI